MNRLPSSLAIALWFVAAIWTVAIAAHVLDAPREIVFISFSLGAVAGVLEWLLHGRSGN
jgi:hypothetical protein